MLSFEQIRHLDSDRLSLEPLEVGHAEEAIEHWLDERLYIYIPVDPPESLGALKRRYEALARRQSADGSELWLNWFMRHRQTGRLIGLVEVTLSGLKADLAYFVFNPHQRMGYAREACARVISELIDYYGTQQLFAAMDTRNTASARLAASLGMTLYEVVENADEFKGARSDEFRYRMEIANLGSSAKPDA